MSSVIYTPAYQPRRFEPKLALQVFAIALCVACLPRHVSAQTNPAGVAGALAVLSELKTAINSAISSGDLAVANRLNDVQTRVEALLKQAQDLQKGIVKDVNSAQADLFGGVHSVLRETHGIVRTEQRLAFLNLNSTLVNASKNLDAIPFVRVDPYVFATDPVRIRRDAADTTVFVYGYFPDVSDSKKATVTIGGKTLELTRYTGNRLAFKLPAQNFGEGTFVDYSISIPKSVFGSTFTWLTTNLKFADKIYIERDRPYSFTVNVSVENPDLYAVVPAQREYHANADSNHVSNIQNLRPAELFSQLVDNPGQYEMDSVVFIDMGHREGGGGPCEHAPWAAQFTGWSANNVSFNLSAGSVGGHFHSAFDFRGGGGSNADIWLVPSFKARKKGVAPFILKHSSQATAGRNAVSDVSVDGSWTSVEIIANFADGNEQWQQRISLDRTKIKGAQYFWSVEIDQNNKVVIQTY